MQSIRIRGAREHNLKNIDVGLPRDIRNVLNAMPTANKEPEGGSTLGLQVINAIPKLLPSPAIPDIAGGSVEKW